MNSEPTRNYLGEVVSVEIPGGLTLDVTVAYGDESRCDRLLVVLPPNPILGGDSENNVVQALLTAAAGAGAIAMTLDYRGVREGRVGGVDLMTYWEELGRTGDYGGIVEDVCCSVGSIRREFGCVGDPVPVGYSFGSFIALQYAARECLPVVGGISPPINEYDYSGLLSRVRSAVFFVAPEDVFCPADSAAAVLRGRGVEVHTFPSDDHFFRGTERALAQQVLGRLGMTRNSL